MATKKTEKKPTKPAKGKYVPPSAEDWKTKPALLKLVDLYGKFAAPAVHKLQHDLKQSRATVKKYAEAIATVIARLGGACQKRGEEFLKAQATTAMETLREALAG